MKRNIVIRLAMVTFITLSSLVLFQKSSFKQQTEDQVVEEEQVTNRRAVSGEFLIWESITRYIMAGYH